MQRILAEHRDLRAPNCRWGMPAGHRLGEQDEVGVLEQLGHRFYCDAGVERVVLRKVDVVGVPAIEHRRAERFGKTHELIYRARITAELLGDDHRSLRRAERW